MSVGKQATICLALWFAVVLGFVGIRVVGAQLLQSDDNEVGPAVTPPRVVVSMTSHLVLEIDCCQTYHYFRVWSDGFTEWNRRNINWDNESTSWRGWESIDDDTGPY